MKSAHREIALWHYDQTTRSTFGYHLRAGTAEARKKLGERLTKISSSEPAVLHFDGDANDPLGLTRHIHKDVSLTIGISPVPCEGLPLAIETAELEALLTLLSQGTQQETCVTVCNADRQLPLWVWPDG